MGFDKRDARAAGRPPDEAGFDILACQRLRAVEEAFQDGFGFLLQILICIGQVRQRFLRLFGFFLRLLRCARQRAGRRLIRGAPGLVRCGVSRR